MSIEELKLLQSNIIRKNKMCNIIGMITIGVIIGISIIFIISKKADIQFSAITIFMELVISIIILEFIKSIVNSKDIEKFEKNFKSIFVLEALKHFFGDIEYKSDEGFSEEYINSVGMLNTADSYSSNDYISGTYKGIKFEQADIHIEEERETRDSDGNTTTYWVTIFLGRLMIFDFNKQFKANVQVSSNNYGANAFPREKEFSTIKMEDVDFNKQFSVYAENEHDAFYILTPHFMEKLKEIIKKLDCGMMFGFVDNRLHIAINNFKDSFEYNVFKPINEQEIEAAIVEDIKVITDFIDELKLDNKLFGNDE